MVPINRRSPEYGLMRAVLMSREDSESSEPTAALCDWSTFNFLAGDKFPLVSKGKTPIKTVAQAIFAITLTLGLVSSVLAISIEDTARSGGSRTLSRLR